MEAPINQKQRSSAMLRFILASSATLLFLIYHILISILAYQG
jgi:hypothetical protein